MTRTCKHCGHKLRGNHQVDFCSVEHRAAFREAKQNAPLDANEMKILRVMWRDNIVRRDVMKMFGVKDSYLTQLTKRALKHLTAKQILEVYIL